MVQNDPNFVPNICLCQKSQILGVFFSFVCETPHHCSGGWSDGLDFFGGWSDGFDDIEKRVQV